MVDTSMNRQAVIWYVNAGLAVVIALVTACAGNAACFIWAGAAWLEWQLGNYLLEKYQTKGDQDEL